MGVAPINSSVLHLSRVCLSALNSKLDFSRMSPYLLCLKYSCTRVPVSSSDCFIKGPAVALIYACCLADINLQSKFLKASYIRFPTFFVEDTRCLNHGNSKCVNAMQE